MFKPENEESYFLIFADGKISKNWNYNHFYTESLLTIGNCFETKKEAEKELEKRKAITRVKEYIDDNFGYFEHDWEDENQEKWFIECYDYELKEFYCNSSNIYKYYSPIGYLKTEEHCEQLKKDCEKSLKIIFKI